MNACLGIQAFTLGNVGQQIDFEGRVTETGRNMTIRIVLADDHEIMQEGMSVLLKRRSGMDVTRQAGEQ